MLRSNTDLLNLVTDLSQHTDHTQISERIIQPLQTLLWRGKYPSCIYVIKRGIVKCFISEENGKEYLLELLSTGEILGELEIIQQSVCISQAETLTETTVYQISIEFFSKQLQQHPHLNKLLLKILAERITNTALRASYQQVYPLAYNLIKLLKWFSEQNKVDIQKAELAGYLGVSARSLNRCLQLLRKEQVVHLTELKLILSPMGVDIYLRKFSSE